MGMNNLEIAVKAVADYLQSDLNDDDEIENGNEFVPYKKLVNAIRKEMKARKLFK